MNEVERLQIKWTELLEREEEIFNHCVELDRTSGGTQTNEKREAVREWWKCANSILWMMVRTRAQHDHELLPYPAFTLGRLANISEEISNGNLPSFVKDARKGGRNLWRAERHHIAHAIYYLEAVESGAVSDRHPNKTVRVAYNVTSETVRNWKRKREDICIGVPNVGGPSKIIERMNSSGKIYSRIGRGAPSD